MSTQASDRRWTATITVGGETVTAGLAAHDLKKDQFAAVVAEAGEYLAAGFGFEAIVTLYKTTRAHGTVRDDAAVVWIGRHGCVRAQR